MSIQNNTSSPSVFLRSRMIRFSGSVLAVAFLLAGAAVVGHSRLVADAAGTAGMRLPAPKMFTTSAVCQGCHNGLLTPSGQDVSIGYDWRSSMMANAARDPYWHAAVRREVIDHPSASAGIQAECSRCHMPMNNYRAQLAGGSGEVFANLPIGHEKFKGDRDAILAADGVACVTCHQMLPDNFGKRESFVGHFLFDEKTPWDERVIMGPFDVDAGRTRIMHSASEFIPEKASHIQQSEMCATCHTLFTHALDKNHEVVGELPEQVPYLEWLHSDYRTEKSCQTCHMPVIEEDVAVTSVWGEPRSDVNRHAFRGGNFVIPRILNANRVELGVEALSTELDASALRSVDHLKTKSATLEIADAGVSDGYLTARIAITNLAGHKLPTAYPSRRVWLHLSVLDGSGNVVFESGKLAEDGSIAGNDHDAAPDVFEPHYQLIDASDKVQIYEVIMLDPQGDVTTGITSGVEYVKDNRMLPKGFDKATADHDVAVHGAAESDPDFQQSGDVVNLQAPLAGAQGPFKLEVELWYQPISYRWAKNLGEYDADEPARFKRYFDDVAKYSAVQLTSVSASVGR